MYKASSMPTVWVWPATFISWSGKTNRDTEKKREAADKVSQTDRSPQYQGSGGRRKFRAGQQIYHLVSECIKKKPDRQREYSHPSPHLQLNSRAVCSDPNARLRWRRCGYQLTEERQSKGKPHRTATWYDADDDDDDDCCHRMDTERAIFCDISAHFELPRDFESSSAGHAKLVRCRSVQIEREGGNFSNKSCCRVSSRSDNRLSQNELDAWEPGLRECFCLVNNSPLHDWLAGKFVYVCACVPKRDNLQGGHDVDDVFKLKHRKSNEASSASSQLMSWLKRCANSCLKAAAAS